MISICIPLFNFEVFPMVKELQLQAEKCARDYEIIIIDDSSDTPFKQQNSILKELNNTRYIELESNIGRSKIRNLLKKESKYPFLLFLDCDLKIIKSDFLSTYITFIEKQNTEDFVICGGHTYEDSSPAGNQKLHWLWGKKCEAFGPEIRAKNPYQSFMTSNFVISSKTMDKIPFNEQLSGYGHEDTLMGFELFKKNITIQHIDNPVEHLGLENNSVFLEKTKESIKNLCKLYNIIGRDTEFLKISKLLNTYLRLKKYRILFAYNIFYTIFEKKIEKKLKGSNPSIFTLNLYKLGLMHKEKKLC